MIPLLVTVIGGFFEELGASFAKQHILARVASVYTIGFLNTLFGALILCGSVIFFNQEFIFSSASLPTFALRSFLEILQAYAAMMALSEADRSTQGFLRVLTLPLLLLVDAILGYALTVHQVIGVGFIVFAFIFLFINHGIRKKGSGLVLFGAINAVATISLYKYDITHYNSVAAEQIGVFVILVAYFLFMAIFISKENPFRAFGNKKLLAQSVLRGAGGVLVSFAYNLASASIITTIKRSGEVLWSILSGNVFFKEKRFIVKVVAFVLMVVGIVFLV
ncbi:MAG: hypothetical protein AAB552_02440 [Patescibacteria group bacterium]